MNCNYRFWSNIVALSKFGRLVHFTAFSRLSTSIIFCLFLMFSIVFPNTELFISLKRVFFKTVGCCFSKFSILSDIGLHPRTLIKGYSSVNFSYFSVPSQDIALNYDNVIHSFYVV